MGRATTGTSGLSGLAGRIPGAIPAKRSSLRRGFTCAWLTTAAQLAPSPVPAPPRLPAALMEMQPEPLASAAPAATGPAQATAATPLTTASATPLIQNPTAHWAAQPLLCEPRELIAPGGQLIG